jgi:hypothetical protein
MSILVDISAATMLVAAKHRRIFGVIWLLSIRS